MKNNFFNYPLTNTMLDKADINSAIKVLKSKWITMGKETLKFENTFSKKISKKHSIMVNSGSSANLLIFQCLINPKVKKLNKNDEVLIPAICWSTSLWPIIQSGLNPKFVDIDLKTLNIDIDEYPPGWEIIINIDGTIDGDWTELPPDGNLWFDTRQ